MSSSPCEKPKIVAVLIKQQAGNETANEGELFWKWQAGIRETGHSKNGQISRASLTYGVARPHSPSYIHIILIYKLSDKLEFVTDLFQNKKKYIIIVVS